MVPTANEIAKHRRVSPLCKMGLEGIVSKRLGSRYRSGRSPDWLKFEESGGSGGEARGGRGLATMLIAQNREPIFRQHPR